MVHGIQQFQKKHHDKFTVELGVSVGSYMVGYIPKTSYNQNAANYNSGYFWYSSSSSLYGTGNKLSFNVMGGAAQGTKIGAVFNRKKGIITFFKDGANVGDAFNSIDKKLKLFPCVDCCSSGSQFKFIKGKYGKIKK